MATVVGVIVKAFVPGSMEFLLLGIVCGLLLRVLRPSLKRVTAAWMASLAIFYLVLSLPWTAKRLAEPLYFYPPVTGPADALGASTLVVLHGDHEGLRVQETFRLYELLLPQRVIVLAGGPRMRDALLGTGIPSGQLLWAGDSRTTREQALQIAALIQAQHIGRVVLVASPIHMPRALAACRAAGVDAVPSVTSRPHNQPSQGLWNLVPGRDAFYLSDESLYEHLALRWYQMRGWV